MIREMTKDDVSDLVLLGSQMHEESYYRQDEYSPTKCAELGFQIVNSPGLLGLIAEVEGEIAGFFLGVIQEQYFSKCLMSSDLLLYVKPEHRKSLIGYRLIKGYIAWAEHFGVPKRNIALGQTANIDSVAVDRLYQKIGFVPMGTIYKLRG